MGGEVETRERERERERERMNDGLRRRPWNRKEEEPTVTSRLCVGSGMTLFLLPVHLRFTLILHFSCYELN